LQLHNLPVDCTTELSKTSKDSSLLFCNEKKMFGFGFRFFVDDIISGVGFWPFWLRLQYLAPSGGWKCFAQVFIQNLAKICVLWAFDWLPSISGSRVRVRLPIYVCLPMTFEPETLESQSKAQKTQILAWFPTKTWVKYFHLALGPSAR